MQTNLYAPLFSLIGSKRPLYGKLSQNLWSKESHSSSRKTIHRAYSVHPIRSSKAIEQAKLSYIQLHEDTNKIKTEKAFKHLFEEILKIFEISESGLAPSLQWDLLQGHLKLYYNYELPPFDAVNLLENIQALLKIRSVPLIKENKTLFNPSRADYIFTPSELFWNMEKVGVPFTRTSEKVTTDFSKIQEIFEQHPDSEVLLKNFAKLPPLDQKVQLYSLLNDEKDAAAATLLAALYLDNDTLLYEIGCWNGQNLLNLLFYTFLQEKSPKYCLGIDINPQALTMAQSFASLLSLREPFIQFYLANALFPLDLKCLKLKYSKEIRLALRVIPIFDPLHGKKFLLNTRKSLKSNQDRVILSYAIPKGKMYEKNLIKVRTGGYPPVTKEEFSEGVVFWQEIPPKEKELLPLHLQESGDLRFVLNTYYTQEGFLRLAQECGFKIINTISVHDADNERNVVSLQPI